MTCPECKREITIQDIPYGNYHPAFQPGARGEMARWRCRNCPGVAPKPFPRVSNHDITMMSWGYVRNGHTIDEFIAWWVLWKLVQWNFVLANAKATSWGFAIECAERDLRSVEKIARAWAAGEPHQRFDMLRREYKFIGGVIAQDATQQRPA